jgi:hypothetical protein
LFLVRLHFISFATLFYSRVLISGSIIGFHDSCCHMLPHAATDSVFMSLLPETSPCNTIVIALKAAVGLAMSPFKTFTTTRPRPRAGTAKLDQAGFR